MDYPKPNLNATGESATGENATIESYLDALCAPLHQMPQDVQDEIRQEIGAHLQSLVAMQREPQRVLESALQQFGDPAEIGRLLMLEWENREWDLSGLSVPQRIEKLRELMDDDQLIFKQSEDRNAVNKRNHWSAAALVSVSILQMAQNTKFVQDAGLHRVLDVATRGAFALSSVFFIVLAIQAWQQQRSNRVSAASRLGAFTLQLRACLHNYRYRKGGSAFGAGFSWRSQR